jgi:hypothetical protein
MAGIEQNKPQVSYNKANIANIDMQFHYSGTFVDTSSIL